MTFSKYDDHHNNPIFIKSKLLKLPSLIYLYTALGQIKKNLCLASGFGKKEAEAAHFFFFFWKLKKKK